jgi:hypothetical protein
VGGVDLHEGLLGGLGKDGECPGVL